MNQEKDIITLDQVNNLSDLFHKRVHKTPEKIAYHYFDSDSENWIDLSWADMADATARWQDALRKENFSAGDRVALMICNCPQWVMFEQAAIGLGLVVVPLYTNDRAENVAYIIDDAEIKLLLIQDREQWDQLRPSISNCPSLAKVVCLEQLPSTSEEKMISLDSWLSDKSKRYPLAELKVHKSTLATIVYTSGTTGKPKGVMLSHGNILWNANSPLDSIEVFENDQFLSFLPLSHMFERTAGYYLPMMSGCTVNYARSIEKLAEDLTIIKPTILITVPRIFERVYNKIKSQLSSKPAFARKLFHSAVNIGWHRFLIQQGKAKWHPSQLLWPFLYFLVGRKIMARLGGNMRMAVSGGAPLSIDIAKTFIGLGLNILQGYGLTETSPVISVNKNEDNEPASVGLALRDVEVRLGENDELEIRSPGVMIGYWNNDQASREMIDPDGWLHTGDKARIENGHIYITGRIKEILVLANGEKVPPADIELAIAKDPLFEQVLIIGEQKPYLSAVNVFNPDEWAKLAGELGIEPSEDNLNNPQVHEVVKQRIALCISEFPGYARVHAVFNTLQPWTVENDLLTPTLKLRRNPIIDKYSAAIDTMYEGH